MSEVKVLVIDDDPIHLYTAKGVIELEGGVTVVTHQGAFGCREVIRREEPDLVLLDVNMPALSGGSVAGLIHPWCRERGIPLYFYSSNDERRLQELVDQHGVDGYVGKGETEALRRLVRSLQSEPRRYPAKSAHGE